MDKMNTLKFKTNIQCNGCIEKGAPYLDKQHQINEWKVDLEHKDRILTVQSTSELNAEEVKEALREAGYKAEKIAG